MASEFLNYPDWVQHFAKKYLGKAASQFIFHGNIHDDVPFGSETDKSFMRFPKFLSSELFAGRDVVIFYDRSGGLHFRDKESEKDFHDALQAIDRISGTGFSKSLPIDPFRVLGIMERYFRLRLPQNRSIAFIIDYAETIIPMLDGASAGTEDRNVLVTLQKWSHDPLFLAADFTTVLLTENLTNLNRSLIQNPHTVSVYVGLPNQKERADFIHHLTKDADWDDVSELSKEVLAKLTAGLSLIHLRGLISSTLEHKYKITAEILTSAKKEIIEAEAYDLLEFVSSVNNLDHVAGHRAVKQKLRDASAALKNGKSEVLPMGYLVCGPVGTGKTWMVTCFSGEVGIPMVKLKNFRSQWQGVTEANLEKILSLIEAMAPVAVMIDEADAYLGNRDQSGDSGVSSRVFSKIATFMSNTDNRGKIIWFLMTARPDLMPIDLKRQGRAEEHLALFHPESFQERKELFEAMMQKTGVSLSEEFVPSQLENENHTWSGADIEAALTRASFLAAKEGAERVSREHLTEAFNDFLPAAYPDEIELQTLVAVMECTSKNLLPMRYKDADRSEILQEIEELKMMLG